MQVLTFASAQGMGTELYAETNEKDSRGPRSLWPTCRFRVNSLGSPLIGIVSFCVQVCTSWDPLGKTVTCGAGREERQKTSGGGGSAQAGGTAASVMGERRSVRTVAQ